MADKVISLKLQLKGSQATITQAEAVAVPIREIATLLTTIKGKSKELADVTRQLKAISKEMAQINQQVKAGAGNADLVKRQDELQNKTRQAADQQARLRRELAETGKGTERYKELVRVVGEHKQRQAEVNAELRKQARDFEIAKAATGSYKQLNLQLAKLRDTYRSISETDRQGRVGTGILSNINTLDTKLKAIDANIGLYTRNVGNYRSALGGLQNITSQFISVTAALELGRQIIRQNAEISDSIADVAKTANASIPDIRKLADELKFRDTRTSLADQLKIAEIGGQLGETADTLAAFTAAVDVLGVALGDEFGGDVGEVTKQVAGLRNSLGDFKTDDVAGDILKLGNALNGLSAAGNSTAGVTADIASRIAGVGTAFGLTAGEILGLASRLDELNIPAERAGGSIQRVLNAIAKSPELFAQLTGKTIPEFTKLVNEDLVAAFTLVLETLGKSGAKTTEFADILDKLNLDGVGAAEIFSKLGQDVGALETSIGRATDALENTDSVYEEFSKKNQTLGAELAKLKNDFLNNFTDSNLEEGIKRVVQVLGFLVNAGAEVVKTFGKIRKAAEDFGTATRNFIDNYVNFFILGGKKAEESVQKVQDAATKTLATTSNLLKAQLEATIDKEEKETTLTAEQIEERLNLQKKADEQAKQLREKRQREALEASRNIQRLQLEALDDTFSGRRERLQRESELAVAALVGTPEQVAEQSKLIRAQLAKDLTALDEQLDTARRKLLDDIQEMRQSIEQGTAELAVQNAQSAVDTVTTSFQQLVEQLRLARAKEFAELEKSFLSGELSVTAFEEKRKALEQKFADERLNLKRQEAAELAVAEADLLQKQFVELEKAFNAEIDQIRAQKAERIKQLGADIKLGVVSNRTKGGDTQSLVQGAIASPTKAAALLAIGQDAQQQELAAEHEFLAEKDRLNSEYINRQLGRQTDLAEGELEILEGGTDAQLELLKKRNEESKKLQEQYSDVITQSLLDIAEVYGDFLTQQKQDSKQFLKDLLTVALSALEKLILIQVAAASAQSYAQPDSVATFGLTGTARALILSALIKATFAGLKGLVEQFKFGGDIPGTSAMGEGEMAGPSHDNGGIKALVGGRAVEFEGGEHKLQNGSETYIINKISSRIFKRELNQLHGNTKQFSGLKRMMADHINQAGGGRPFTTRKYQDGGALNITPAPAPVLLPSGGGTEAMMQFMGTMQEQIAAVNARIDRIIVIANPLQLAKEAQKLDTVKQARRL